MRQRRAQRCSCILSCGGHAVAYAHPHALAMHQHPCSGSHAPTGSAPHSLCMLPMLAYMCLQAAPACTRVCVRVHAHIVCACVHVCVCACVPGPAPSGQVVVEGVDGELKKIAESALSTKPNFAYTLKEVQADVGRVFNTGWFAEVNPDAEDTRDGVRLTVRVRGGVDLATGQHAWIRDL